MFTIPAQLGPTTRIPASRICALIRFWVFFPSSPLSPRPAAWMMMLLTPFSIHCSITPGTALAAIWMNAVSTASGRSFTEGKQGMPATSVRPGFTA